MSDLPPPYPGPSDKKGEKEDYPVFNNSTLPPPPPYEGLENDRVVITDQIPSNIIFDLSAHRILIPPTRQGAAERIESYLFLSIFTLVCCCIPLGMIATVLSCQVGLYAQRGEVKKARYVSEKAKHIATIGILIGTFTALYYFVQRATFFDPMNIVGNNYGNNMEMTRKFEEYHTETTEMHAEILIDFNQTGLIN